MNRKPKTAYELEIEKQPPLSDLDRGLLIAICVIGMADGAALMGLWYYMLNIAPFQEPELMASVETAACFWILPGFFLTFFVGLFGAAGLIGRYALFGLPGAVYRGSSRRDMLGYPLFMDLTEAPEPVRRKVRRERRFLAGWLAALALSLCCAPMSWQGRACVYRDGSLRVYSAVGTVRSDGEIETMTIRITPPRSGRYGQAHYELELQVQGSDGKQWRYEEKNLAGDTLEEYLRFFLDLKEKTGTVTLENGEWVVELIRDRECGQEASKMLHELFEVYE